MRPFQTGSFIVSVLLLVASWTVPARAQTIAPSSADAQITADADCVIWGLANSASLTVTITGTGAGTYTFSSVNDAAATKTNIPDVKNQATGTTGATTTTNGTYWIPNPGFGQLFVCGSGGFTGTATLTATRGFGMPSNTSATIGDVTIDLTATNALLDGLEPAFAVLNAKTADFDTGAGTQTVVQFGIALPASGGAVAGGTATNPIRIDTTGTTTQPVSGPLTDAQLRATAVPVSGPLTDAQLRATPVPVSGSITATGPLTDTQLRASAVPVSGPLTDTQLRASAVPVSAASLPLPTGAATAGNQTTTNASLGSIDGKLPALSGGKVPVECTGCSGSGSNAAAGATGSAVPSSGDYQGVNVGGTLRGVTGLALGSTFAPTFALVDASGNQITSFGGAGGTASNYGSAFPSSGTAVGYSDGTNMQGARVVDADTSGGTFFVLPTNPVFRTSGTPVEAGTSSNPWNVVFPSAQAVTASGNWPVRTQDGAGNALTSSAAGSTRPLDIIVRDTSGNPITAFGGSGGTASNFGSAFPTPGTAAGFSDGANMQGARVFDGDSGGGTQYVAGAILRKVASGGTVEAGTSSDPLRTDPTGSTTQPVSGTVTANMGTVAADPFGATADAIVAAGAAGSISAKLRRISQGLEDLKTAIALTTSTATIGAVRLKDSGGTEMSDTTSHSVHTVAVDPSTGTAYSAPATGNGAVGATVQRFALASDNTLPTGWPSAGNQSTEIGHLANLATYLQPGTMKRYISVGTSEDESQVSASPGVLLSMSAWNANATTDAFLKCTNLTAANTTPGSSTVFFSMIVPHGSSGGSGFVQAMLGPGGVTFGTALTCYIVTGKADSDATEVAANDVAYNLVYR